MDANLDLRRPERSPSEPRCSPTLFQSSRRSWSPRHYSCSCSYGTRGGPFSGNGLPRGLAGVRANTDSVTGLRTHRFSGCFPHLLKKQNQEGRRELELGLSDGKFRKKWESREGNFCQTRKIILISLCIQENVQQRITLRWQASLASDKDFQFPRSAQFLAFADSVGSLPGALLLPPQQVSDRPPCSLQPQSALTQRGSWRNGTFWAPSQSQAIQCVSLRVSHPHFTICDLLSKPAHLIK